MLGLIFTFLLSVVCAIIAGIVLILAGAAITLSWIFWTSIQIFIAAVVAIIAWVFIEALF